MNPSERCVTRSRGPNLLVLLLVGLSAPQARAQTGSALLLKTWDEQKSAEVRHSSLILADGDSTGGDVDLRIHDASGRVRLDPEDERKRSLGFDFTYIDLGPSGSRLVDQSLGFGFGLGRAEGWEFALTAGLGYAGNNPFGDGTAFYGMGSLIASKELDERSNLQVILSYHGNRSIFPDVPLPAIAYSRRPSDTFQYTIGLPFSSMTWQPRERLTVDLRYAIPLTMDATVRYEVREDIELFAGFFNRFQGFWIDGESRERRTFFRQRRVEAGVRWAPSDLVSLAVAGGFAFDQELQTGFDARDLDTVSDLSDEPFVRLEAKFQF